MTEDLTVEELQRRLQAATEFTTGACREEIAEVLRRHRCRLVSQVYVTDDGRIASNIIVMPAGPSSPPPPP